jgi:hypothetical protein
MEYIEGKTRIPRGPTLKRARSAFNKIPEQLEASITKSIRALLKSQGIWHFKLHQGLGSTPGIPDIIGIWKGKFLAIEVKTRLGKLSEQQIQKLDEINQAGGLAFVARNIDDVIEQLGIGDRFLFSKGRNLP